MMKPEWLKIKAQSSPELLELEGLIRSLSLNTVCDEAACPNRLECFGRHTATFMILGKSCTRNCAFCNVESTEQAARTSQRGQVPVQAISVDERGAARKGDAAEETGAVRKGDAVDAREPENVAKAVDILALKHVVITSVTRDDLDDGGSTQFVSVIAAIKKLGKPNLTIEVLIPDFAGNLAALRGVVAAHPDVIGHNVETVPRLYPNARAQANYERSLNLLSNVKALDPTIFTKSSIMLGLGETRDEVLDVFADLRNVGCDFLCIGQYLSPTKLHHPVIDYIHPDEFERYRLDALALGFRFVASAPFVRSSYHADEAMDEAKR